MTVIISTGVLALLSLMATGTVLNVDNQNTMQGMQLVNSIKEMMVGMPVSDPDSPTTWGPETAETWTTYDDIDDFDGFNTSAVGGPLDARRQVLADMEKWTQQITVETVDPDAMKVTIPDGTEPTVRVTVIIRKDGKIICRAGWLIATTG